MCKEHGCSACHMAKMSYDDEMSEFPYCSERRKFKYFGLCGKKRDKSLCGSDDLDICFNSFPAEDKAKTTDERACRPVPQRL